MLVSQCRPLTLLPQSTHGSRAVPSDYENEPHSGLPLHPVDLDPHDMPPLFSDSPPDSLSRRAKVSFSHSPSFLLTVPPHLLTSLLQSSMASFHAPPRVRVRAPRATPVLPTRVPMRVPNFLMPPPQPQPQPLSPPTLTCPPSLLCHVRCRTTPPRRVKP